MALKKKISKAEFEKLADHLKTEYVERGDGYILDLEGDDVLERAKEHEKELRKAAEAEAKQLKERLATMDDEGMRKRGDIEALDKSWGEKLAAREKELNEKLGKRDSHLKGTLVDAVAQKIASTISTSPSLIMPHIKSRLVADLDGETPMTKVLDKNGQLSALTIEELQNEFVTNPEFGAIIIGSKATGSRAPSQNVLQNRAFGSDTKPIDLSKLSPTELVAYKEAQKTGA